MRWLFGHRRLLWAASATIILLIVAAGSLLTPVWSILFGLINGEPFFNGRPASYWRDHIRARGARFDSPPSALAAALENLLDRTRRRGLDEFDRFHLDARDKVEALPVLLWLLEDDDRHVRSLAVRYLLKHGGCGDLSRRVFTDPPNPEMAPGSSPLLAQLLKKDIFVATMVECLQEDLIGRGAWAPEALRRLGPAAKGALPYLHKVIEHAPPYTASNAADALATVSRDDAEIRNAYFSLLAKYSGSDVAEANTRASVLHGLAGLGLRARPAYPAIRRYLHDPSAEVAASAARALVCIDSERSIYSEDRQSIEALLERGEKPSWSTYDVLTRVRMLGPDARLFVPCLERLLNHPEPAIAKEAARTLLSLDSGTAKRKDLTEK